MKAFAELYTALDETNKTTGKVEAMVRYFQSTPPEDAAWGLYFLTGRRPKRPVNTTKLWTWAQELSGLPGWLFSECYDAVADLAETIAKIVPEEEGVAALGRYGVNEAGGVGALGHDRIPDTSEGACASTPQRRNAGPSPPDNPKSVIRNPKSLPLHLWVTERLLPLAGMTEEEQKVEVMSAWRELDTMQRHVYNKLITGEFRIGVSQDLVIRAVAQASGIPSSVIAHRLMGAWQPTAEFYQSLFSEDHTDADISKPYPFCLAHPLEGGPEALGDPGQWQVEWKYDGIRAQLVKREGQTFVWSRGEELISERFPEVRDIGAFLPDGTVLDGEIMAWRGEHPLPFADLQKRIGRKIVGKKLLVDVPVVLVAYDLLEWQGEDVRERSMSERRGLLEELVTAVRSAEGPAMQEAFPEVDSTATPQHRNAASPNAPPSPPSPKAHLRLSPVVVFDSWEHLADKRQASRDLNVEGVMLKRKDSPYMVGRKKGYWWKWKIEPYSVDCVLIYAARGNGIRASLYTDYTFGVWNDEGQLVPFAKAYSGLTDTEIREVDSWVRRNTLEKFGPVRTVKPELVFELAFEGIQLSSRHKSGVAVRFPRMARWRKDKKIEDADSLETVKALIRQ